MSIQKHRDLHAFLSTYFPDSEPHTDEFTARAFLEKSTPELRERIVTQGRLLLADKDLSIEEFGAETNRWFSDSDEACAWLKRIVGILDESRPDGYVTVKDSNGALLSEGDSVQVIKDLKVKGGSSDLKRGTLIKKIHLTDDPEAVECRVGGATLVLKTCFLKKA